MDIHPDIARELIRQRHAQLLDEAEVKRLVGSRQPRVATSLCAPGVCRLGLAHLLREAADRLERRRPEVAARPVAPAH